MRPDPLLGLLDRDLACAIALGVVDNPRVAVTAKTITVHDGRMQSLGTVTDWLAGPDPLDQATLVYLEARLQAIQASQKKAVPGAWGASAAIKSRDEANRRAIDAKTKAMALLAERGVIEAAKKAGLRIIQS